MQGIAFAVIMAIGLAAVAYFVSRQRPLTHESPNTSRPDYQPRNSWSPPSGSSGRSHQRKKQKKNPDCPICLDPISENAQVMELPCDHWLHYDCGVQWIQLKRVCPLCRTAA